MPKVSLSPLFPEVSIRIATSGEQDQGIDRINECLKLAEELKIEVKFPEW